MPEDNHDQVRRVPAIKVRQWLPEWEDVVFDKASYRSRPPKFFYLFSLPASDLRALSGIFRRSTVGGLARSRDLGIQRRHDSSRSDEIREFVRNGFPWSSLSQQRRESGEFDDLKKPGWLPTAIVVNILRGDDSRRGEAVHINDLIESDEQDDSLAQLRLPRGFNGANWQPTRLPPIEVIDGQHRLWAFEDRDFAEGFSLPVVAFHGLDISWQAYLFYTINIKPKRINTSLAFDLYPLLRNEDWLEKFEGHSIYRETRAQETEALWSFPESPWHQRIDMLGGGGGRVRMVTQAAWIRSLLTTFVKTFEGRKVKIGGLFGAAAHGDRPALGWSRPLQSAFIITIWREIRRALSGSSEEWAQELRAMDPVSQEGDAAFSGRHTLLNTDQGVRGVLAIANDLSFLEATNLELDELDIGEVGDGAAHGSIKEAIDLLQISKAASFLKELGEGLATYDWRTASAPGLSESERQAKARFRGSGGYRELRSDLVHHLVVRGGRLESPAVKVAEAFEF